jgi:hypothetical protein
LCCIGSSGFQTAVKESRGNNECKAFHNGISIDIFVVSGFSRSSGSLVV